MSAQYDPKDIFDEFAMEQDLSHALLKSYIERYPDLAIELTDLFHELTLADARTAAENIPLETKSVNAAALAGEKLRAAFSNDGIKTLARTIGLPRDFLTGFRDRRVRIGSAPVPVLTGLARKIGVGLHDFVGFACADDRSSPALAFKADNKPMAAAQLDFGDFVEGLALTSDEEEALQRLAQDGSG